MPEPLKPEELLRRCDATRLGFTTSDEFEAGAVAGEPARRLACSLVLIP